MGLPYKEGEAKQRIDTLARWLASVWTIFLMYLVIAQGNKDGAVLTLFDHQVRVLPAFALAKEEFIAVFTTTTASVFGFLVIVANHLFKVPKS